jgi:hypothetical protein
VGPTPGSQEKTWNIVWIVLSIAIQGNDLRRSTPQGRGETMPQGDAFARTIG